MNNNHCEMETALIVLQIEGHPTQSHSNYV